MVEKLPMTAAGYTVLEQELKHRQQVERRRIIQQITDARTHGDLSENAEYHAAREDQGMLQARIDSLKDKLSRAYFIDKNNLASDSVVFGAKVKVKE